MSLKLQLARKCKELRQENKISLKKWSKYLGLKEEQINNFEKGIDEIPTLVLQEYLKLKLLNEGKK